jgi:hypothetical protein
MLLLSKPDSFYCEEQTCFYRGMNLKLRLPKQALTSKLLNIVQVPEAAADEQAVVYSAGS